MRRSNPFEEIERTFERMSRQFDEMGRQWDGWPPSGMQVRSHDVSVDVADYDDSVVVMADLPGYEREEIDLTIDGDRLSIAASRTRESESGDAAGEYVRRERRSESVRRSVTLPAAVDESAASATYTNGVLTVRLPKLETDEHDSHRIDVE
jgi:HSP20 family protein